MIRQTNQMIMDEARSLLSSALGGFLWGGLLGGLLGCFLWCDFLDGYNIKEGKLI